MKPMTILLLLAVSGTLTEESFAQTSIQLLSTIPEPGDSHQRPRWTPTGLSVNPGDTLVIESSGQVNDGGGNVAGPNGTGKPGDPSPSYPDWYNSVSHISVIGRLRLADSTLVPLDDGIDTSGKGIYGPGFVGSSFTIVVAQSGFVELSINDGDTQNNSGSFTCIVRVRIALPIQISSFKAVDAGAGSIKLEWITISETNNFGFYVQRGDPSGTTFTDLTGAFIPGHGTTAVSQEYVFFDSAAPSGSLWYRLKQVDLDGSSHFSEAVHLTSTANTSVVEPVIYELYQNYPNPFNPITTIRYGLPQRVMVTLIVYNTLGQKITELVHGSQDAGHQAVRFDGTNLASGVYFYRLQAGSFVQTRKLLLLR